MRMSVACTAIAMFACSRLATRSQMRASWSAFFPVPAGYVLKFIMQINLIVRC